MKTKTVLVLGGGWGGLTAAHALRGMIPAEYKVVVIERKRDFVFYPSYLKAMVGETEGLKYIESPLKDLLRKDIEIINDEVVRIDPVSKTVDTRLGSYSADYIIIAMGAELYPETIPGFRENCLNLYDTSGVFEIHNRLKEFSKGKIAVLITRTPFRCPPAPYESAMLTDWFMREKGVRNDVEISVYTPEKFPMPTAGEKVGHVFTEMLEGHNINLFFDHTVSGIESDPNHIHFTNDETAEYDLIIGIPLHGAPRAIVESGLTNASGYIPVHPQTMELLSNLEELKTQFPGVYAIGDNAGVQLLNGKYLPKGGVFAEEEAHAVARNIAAQINGEKPVASFNGRGICYVDVGDGMAAEGSGDFYAYPEPIVNLQMPSSESRSAKHEMERMFEWWFKAYQKN